MLPLPTNLAVYMDTLDPVILQLWAGGPAIRWYGVSYLAGFALGFYLIQRIVKAGRSSLQSTEVGDLVITIALSLVIGGRVGYVLFYKPDLLGFTGTFPYWGVLQFTQGGMSFHGGAIGAGIGCLLYARRHKHDPGHIADLIAFVAPLGLFLGRLANFINGELYGRPCDPAPPWAVKFPGELLHFTEPQWNRFLLFIGDTAQMPVSREDAVARIIHGDPILRLAAQQTLTPRHPSQLYEALAEGLVLFVVLAVVWRKPRKPWVLSAWFLLAYAVLRIICEFFREPDAHIADQEFARWHLTRGQLLSAVIFLAGAILLCIVSRRKVQPQGGWRGARE